MDEIANPHGTYFRESFGRREVARNFPRVQLPADLLAGIEFDSLEIAKDTYVSSDLRPAFSDLVSRSKKEPATCLRMSASKRLRS